MKASFVFGTRPELFNFSLAWFQTLKIYIGILPHLYFCLNRCICMEVKLHHGRMITEKSCFLLVVRYCISVVIFVKLWP